MPKLSIIVPIYNALNDVKNLLNSLNKNFNFELGEIFLVNDCSDKKTSDYLDNFNQKNQIFKLINNKENLGFVKSCNKGMKEATGEILVLLNSDTIIPKNFCEKIIKCFESNSQIGVASPIGSHTASYYIPLPFGWTIEKMNIKLEQKHKCTYPIIPAAEGFCFCIRKEVIEQQGYLDEIYGRGYHEEVDFAYRSITNGWKNVLIDNLYVYHKRHASFGKKQREILIAKNDAVFNERWYGFRGSYIKEHNLENPIWNIRKELGIKLQKYNYTFAENIFSAKNSKDKKYKIISILGFRIKLKKTIKFPKQAKSINLILNESKEFNHKRALIFAGFNAQARIEENTVKYLTELKNYADFIVFVNDNPIIESEITKIKDLVDVVICEKHGEYDFGSYKRGYFKLKELGVLDKIDNLLICNDSVLYVGNSLKEVFDKNDNYDFYGITQHGYAYQYNEAQRRYNWTKLTHIQSYFFELSKNVFKTDWLEEFFRNVQLEKTKREVVIKYEQGLNRLIISKGFDIHSFYPATEETLGRPEVFWGPYRYNHNSCQIFIKKNSIKDNNLLEEYSLNAI